MPQLMPRLSHVVDRVIRTGECSDEMLGKLMTLVSQLPPEERRQYLTKYKHKCTAWRVQEDAKNAKVWEAMSGRFWTFLRSMDIFSNDESAQLQVRRHKDREKPVVSMLIKPGRLNYSVLVQVDVNKNSASYWSLQREVANIDEAYKKVGKNKGLKFNLTSPRWQIARKIDKAYCTFIARSRAYKVLAGICDASVDFHKLSDKSIMKFMEQNFEAIGPGDDNWSVLTGQMKREVLENGDLCFSVHYSTLHSSWT